MKQTEPIGSDVSRIVTANPFADRMQVEHLPRFWQRIAAAPHVGLFLDFDGTLAPFHADRMQAYPLPGTREAIERIAAGSHTSVALVSGRPISEILELLGDIAVTIVGAHGYEARLPDGNEMIITISPEQSAILDAAYAEALRLFIPDRVERKAASVAAHFRGLEPRAVADVEAQLERSWRATGVLDIVEFRPFNGGLELRAAGRNKGTAIEELLESMPPETLPVYIGDDDTDEDAFRQIAGRGIGIKVGPLDAVTAADGRLLSIEAVRQLLADWPATPDNAA
jgi:trehalose 6-phosphate phosphatase